MLRSAWRGFGGRAALVALVLSALPLGLSPAQASAAETPVTIRPAEVSSALFIAGDVTRLSRVPAGTEDVVLEKALQQMYADEPELAPTLAESYVRDMELLLGSGSAPSQASLQLMAGNQRVLAILAALERPYGSPSVELPPAAKLAVTHLAAVALSGSSDIFAGAEEPKYFEPLADARTNLTYTSFAPATVLRATRQLAAGNTRFGEARDALWGKASEESVFSEWAELLKESRTLQGEALEEVREAIEAGHGTLTEEPAKLTAMFTAGQKSTQEQSCQHGGTEEAIGGSTIEGVPQLKCSGGALYEAAHVPRSCTEKATCEAELTQLQSNAAKQARVIAEERAEMTAAAELLRPSDNTAAALQEATAQAQAQITEEETAYANYEAEKAQREAIAGGVKEGLEGGTAVLALATDNYSEGISGLIGVGFELYENIEGGLSNPPPGPQEITLQDLADLSTQLSGFQQYTQEAFHAINTQLAQLSSQLARENYELKEELSALGERLQKEQGTIFALQDQVKELFAAQTKANLQSTIEDSVGWLGRTGEPLSPSKFQEALVALKKYATEIAKGPLVNSSELQSYNFEGAFRQLTGKVTGEPTELGEDISYLARFPSEAGWVGTLAPSSLANTAFWSESSRAYAQLMLENASHTTAADIAGLRELEKEGFALEKTENAWSALSGGPGSTTGNAILDKAIADVERAAQGTGVDGVDSIQTLLQKAAEGSLEKELEKFVRTGSPLANPTNFELWGGAQQSFSASAVATAKYPALKWTECGGSAGSNGSVDMPEQFIATMPAVLVNGVRTGVIGAPGTGDPLILEVCRTINRSSSVTKTEEKTGEEPCGEGYTSETCQDVYENEIKSENQPETVGETFTLKEGEGGPALASSSVGSCSQTGLFWTGVVHGFSRDPTDEEFNGVVEKYQELTNATFSGRHVGSAFELSASGNKVSWKYNTVPFEGAHCPYEGSEEKTGVEYADYEQSAKPLGATAESTLLQDVEGKLRELQKEAYEAGLDALLNPAKGNPTESLGGARALVQSYIKLGLPQAVDSNLALQSDIEGLGAQFLDPEPGSPRPVPAQLTALVRKWIHRLEGSTDPELGRLLREDLIEEVATRSSRWTTELAEQLKPYVEGNVAGFGSGSEAVNEQSAVVESTLNRLQLTRDVLTEARAPTAETLAPSEVGTDAATVRGEVDPNGGAVESCTFEYGATDFYGHHVECSAIPSATEKAVVVSAQIANWTHEGSFHERVVLKTWGGTSYGEDVKVQLAQSTMSPSGDLLIASTDTSGATIGEFTAEELPPGVELPAGAMQIVGSLKFSVNVTPGGSARVKIELPSGSAPNALYKLRRNASGGEEYVEIPSSLYTISENMIELTLVDGGADDEDGEVNGVIVDPLVPVVRTRQPAPASSSTSSTPPPTTPPAATQPPTGKAPAEVKHNTQPAPRECISHGAVTVHVSDLKLPKGTTARSIQILVGGHVVATLGGRATAAVVSFAGLRKARYEITLVAKLSNGHTLTRKIRFHACGLLAAAPHECVSRGSVTVHISDLKLPRGAGLEQSEILLGREVVATLSGRAPAAVVSFAGRQGPYRLTLAAKLSNGHTLRGSVIFHACAQPQH